MTMLRLILICYFLIPTFHFKIKWLLWNISCIIAISIIIIILHFITL